MGVGTHELCIVSTYIVQLRNMSQLSFCFLLCVRGVIVAFGDMGIDGSLGCIGQDKLNDL